MLKPMNKTVKRLNYIAKAALALLLLHALVYADLPQYQNKGMFWRILIFPLFALLVPLIYFFSRSKRPYPHLIDLLVVLPFLIDTAGNTANLYDSVDWWDDIMHFVTWVPWVLAFGLTVRLLNNKLGRLNVAMLTLGFGAVTHIIWELLEYVSFITSNPNEMNTAYRDTMGDFVFSLCGSIFGAILVSTVLWNAQTPKKSKRR